ncbi:MAG: arylsulfotransferase family protein, partial [Candidatus Aminicenantales bacterium]
PFVYILYFQIAGLVLAGVVFISIRRDFFLLAVAAAWLAAYVLGQAEPAAALAGLFVVAFIGRSLLPDPRRRRLFSLAAAAAAGLGYIAFLFFFRVSGEAASVPDALRAEAMKSLPYSSFAAEENGKRDGVIEFRRSAAEPGLNLYNSYYQAGAALLDMDGHVLHRWQPETGGQDWHYVRLLPNGDLLVCIEDELMMRLDWSSRVLWKTPMRAHHDISVAENGDIYTLSGAEEMAVLFGQRVPVVNEYIEVLDGVTGASKKRLSLFSLFGKDVPFSALGRVFAQIFDPPDYLWRVLKQEKKGRPLLRRLTGFDIFHANALKVIDRTISGLCRKGDLLLSMRSIDRIAIVDPDGGAVRWSWGTGALEEQHDPSLLDNGHILVFDNGTRRKFSRIVEIDPSTRSIVWEYRDLGAAGFYSSWGGAAQRLLNGNTLITDSDDGRVFEVTKGGERVWLYMNPDDGPGGKRATIYRMTRITDPSTIAALLRMPTAH